MISSFNKVSMEWPSKSDIIFSKLSEFDDDVLLRAMVHAFEADEGSVVLKGRDKIAALIAKALLDEDEEDRAELVMPTVGVIMRTIKSPKEEVLAWHRCDLHEGVRTSGASVTMGRALNIGDLGLRMAAGLMPRHLQKMMEEKTMAVNYVIEQSQGAYATALSMAESHPGTSVARTIRSSVPHILGRYDLVKKVLETLIQKEAPKQDRYYIGN